MIINSTTTTTKHNANLLCVHTEPNKKHTRKRNHRHNTDNELGYKFTSSAPKMQSTLELKKYLDWSHERFLRTMKLLWRQTATDKWKKKKHTKYNVLKLNERFLTSASMCVALWCRYSNLSCLPLSANRKYTGDGVIWSVFLPIDSFYENFRSKLGIAKW